ncbi:MAG: hypothetical protein IAF38_07285 [Bacteroidia bacterium]|nr:hypothetical protein [Bacteroidia bacterium]
MKTIKFLSFVLIMSIGISGTACKTSKGASSSAKTVTADNYRLIITFISKGGGTDGKALEAITKFLDEHAKKPVYEKFNWGREGERDFCLKLSEFSTKEQKNFIEEVKKIAANSELVQFSENAPCVHKK